MSSEQRHAPTEDDLTATRRAKLAELRAQGWSYPNHFTPTKHAGELHAAFGETDGAQLDEAKHPATVAGRVVAKRAFGQASFVVVEDVTGRIQTYLRRDQLTPEEHALAKSLDLGDLIGVAGWVFRTRTGELSVHGTSVVLLAKCVHPLPEKWHGLTDVEIRYRKRYLDLIANGAESRPVFLSRSKILAGIRSFLVARDYVEVETPILQSIAGGAAARPFLTHHNTLDMELQLRIAPELFLKRLLVGGFERVFEIGRNFRNEGISTQHNPEFTMLEFYQAYATCDDLLPLVEEMIGGLALALHGTTKVKYGEHDIELGAGWTRLSLIDAAAAAAGCAPHDLRNEPKARAVAQQHGVPIPPGAGAGGIATALFEHFVEPTLIQPTFVTGFPAEVSPLARANDDDPFVVDRFELYVVGRELANGFSELNDPDDQRARFLKQLENRGQGDDEAHPMDEDYVHALEHGMPPAAGCGIGVDRLTMLLCNAQSIRDVVLFPLLRPAAKA
ncbi:lysine--tRNA ligase [Candidatus Binatia bacterium]|jgi:lysyl-tRNA synthetase class 2|nr:lysine--tRNA ligase [Candidatus Binatia bacterium]